jgi:hypothetical protein
MSCHDRQTYELFINCSSLGPAIGSSQSLSTPSFGFPHDEKDMKEILEEKSPIPFLREDFELVIDKFRLPGVTPWIFTTLRSHFHQHFLYDPKSPSLIGMWNML